MRKIVLIMLVALIVLSGCSSKTKNPIKEDSSGKTDYSSKIDDSNDKNNTVVVYCENCAEESHEKTKFCPNCGAQAKWLSEKPDISSNKTEEPNKDVEVKTENETEEPKKEENTIVSKKSYKAEYLKKLDTMAEEIKKSEEDLYTRGSTADIIQAQDEIYSKWDKMLNEIYALLKTQLSEAEMNTLREKQIEWIKYRDNTAQEEGEKEGSDSSLNYIVHGGTLCRLTRERCYELVNTYLE